MVSEAHAGWPAGLGQQRRWRQRVDQDSSPEVWGTGGVRGPVGVGVPWLDISMEIEEDQSSGLTSSRENGLLMLVLGELSSGPSAVDLGVHSWPGSLTVEAGEHPGVLAFRL